MKKALLFFGLAAFVAVTEGSELNRESVFDSIVEFVTAMKAFQPAVSKGRLAALFAISEKSNDEQRTSVTATAIETCDNIWSDETSALLLPSPVRAPSRQSRILEFCFYSFAGATVGGSLIFCVLPQLEKTRGSPRN